MALDLFSSRKKAQNFKDKMAEIAARPDTAERLVAYASMKKETDDARRTAIGRLLVSSAAVIVCGGILSGLALSLPTVGFLGAGFSLAAVLTFIVKASESNVPLETAFEQLKSAIDSDIKTARIEELRTSPHLHAALAAVPALRTHFKQAAEDMILFGIAPAAAPAARTQKTPQA